MMEKPDMCQLPLEDEDDNRGHEMLVWVLLLAAVFYLAIAALIWWVLA